MYPHGSTHPASLKSKTEATSLVCKPRRVGEVTVSSRSGHQTWLGNAGEIIKVSLGDFHGWWQQEGTLREHDASRNGECWCLPLIQWILPLNGEFCPGPSSVFLRILQIFPSTNSMNHSKWSQVVSSADMFFSDKCRSQRDFHRVDLVFTILNWLSKLLLKGIVSPLHHHYIHPQDHHCIPDTSRYFQLPSIYPSNPLISPWFLSCGTCPSNGRLGEFDGWITY